MKMPTKLRHTALAFTGTVGLALLPAAASAEKRPNPNRIGNQNESPVFLLLPVPAPVALDTGRPDPPVMRESRVEPTGVPGTRKIISVRYLADGSQEVTENLVDDTGTVLSTSVYLLFPGKACDHCGVRGPRVRYDKHVKKTPSKTRGFRHVVETWTDSGGKIVYSTVYLEGPNGERFEFGMDGTGAPQ